MILLHILNMTIEMSKSNIKLISTEHKKWENTNMITISNTLQYQLT